MYWRIIYWPKMLDAWWMNPSVEPTVAHCAQNTSFCISPCRRPNTGVAMLLETVRSSRQVAFKLGSMRIRFQLKWPLQNKIGTPYFQSGYILIYQSCYNKSVGSIHTVVWRYHKSRWPTWSDCLFDLSCVLPPLLGHRWVDQEPGAVPGQPGAAEGGGNHPAAGQPAAQGSSGHTETRLRRTADIPGSDAHGVKKLHCGEHPQLENLEKVVMCVCTKCWMVKEF